MPDPDLILRRTVIGGDRLKDDFCVFFGGRRVGRIRLASERVGFSPGCDWAVNPPLPVPADCVGSEPSLEEAKVAFRQAWERFFVTLSPEEIAHWHDLSDRSERR